VSGTREGPRKKSSPRRGGTFRENRRGGVSPLLKERKKNSKSQLIRPKRRVRSAGRRSDLYLLHEKARAGKRYLPTFVRKGSCQKEKKSEGSVRRGRYDSGKRALMQVADTPLSTKRSKRKKGCPTKRREKSLHFSPATEKRDFSDKRGRAIVRPLGKKLRVGQKKKSSQKRGGAPSTSTKRGGNGVTVQGKTQRRRRGRKRGRPTKGRKKGR